jgi:hypothetical protein
MADTQLLSLLEKPETKSTARQQANKVEYISNIPSYKHLKMK